ncbi:MAG: BamA/TamA family outer membrane protein, partial [Candidatus Latescibacterota bacterium]
LPSSHYDIVGLELESDLRTRRELLPEITEEYYQHLAGEVDIQATDRPEVVEVVRHSDGLIDVSIGTRSDGEDATTPYYNRRFAPEDTEEIRVYLHGGDDLVTVTGHGNTKIELRVISGDGQDKVINDSGRRGVTVYDSRREGGVVVEGGVVDRREYMAPELDRWAPQDWGSRRVWKGRFDIGGDIGPFLGARVVRETYGFRKDGYARQLSARLGYSFMLNAFTLGLDLSRRWENSKKIGNLNLLLSGIESINFYGFGNETQPPANDSAADVDRRVARLEPSMKLALSRDWTFSLGVPFQYSKTMDDSGTILGTTNPYGTGDFWQAGLRVGLVHDSRNVPTWPTSGVLLDLQAAFYPEVFDVEDGSFRSLEGVASGVHSVFRFLALAGRIGA